MSKPISAQAAAYAPIVAQSNGQIAVAAFEADNILIARCASDGPLDPSFGTNRITFTDAGHAVHNGVQTGRLIAITL